MNISRVIELTNKLTSVYNELMAEVGGQPITGGMVPLNGNAEISKKGARKLNKTTKEKLISIFKDNPERGFTIRDLCAKIPVSDSLVRRQVRYLNGANFVEKIGDAFRLRDGSKKPKINKAENVQAEGIETQILESLRKNPSGSSGIARSLRIDFYNVRDTLKSLKQAGVIKEVDMAFTTADGSRRTSRRFVPADYEEKSA